MTTKEKTITQSFASCTISKTTNDVTDILKHKWSIISFIAAQHVETAELGWKELTACSVLSARVGDDGIAMLDIELPMSIHDRLGEEKYALYLSHLESIVRGLSIATSFHEFY